MRKVALVTGGSRGIGLGIAKELAKNNFDLAINGVRDESDVAETLKDLGGAGADVIYCQGNLASPQERQRIIEKVKGHFGRLNTLVNNAGIAPRERRDILEATEESFDEVISTNLKGNYFLTQQVANWMIGQKKLTPNSRPASSTFHLSRPPLSLLTAASIVFLRRASAWPPNCSPCGLGNSISRYTKFARASLPRT
jgi:3-oxoacyl-[acyl-carrier protein] reductase